MATVRLPAPLRAVTGGSLEVTVAGGTVGEVMADLVARHPGLHDRLLDDAGQPARWVNVFVGTTDVRALAGTATPVAQDDVVTVVPAVAGG